MKLPLRLHSGDAYRLRPPPFVCSASAAIGIGQGRAQSRFFFVLSPRAVRVAGRSAPVRAPCCGWPGTHPRFEHRRGAGPRASRDENRGRRARASTGAARARTDGETPRATRGAGRNTRRQWPPPIVAPHCPSSLGGNIPLPGPPACLCPLPRASAYHPRLFSPAQLPRPPPSVTALFFPVCSTSWGFSYLAVPSALRLRKPPAAEGSRLGCRRTTGEVLFDIHKLED